ncbi:MAG: aminotransferase class I/II-fold pyridoxal phosphate-dependent enzyme [Deltaproteobacteria bacterium]|nr:MAG: aminotransferase class I/II-fold pyridoxal phosphate-dependent enzyme [Deltaproteobacteria bacterium]
MRTSEDWHRRDLSHFRRTTGADLFDVHEHFADWLSTARPGGYHLYEAAAHSAPSTSIRMSAHGDALINLASYNYLGLSVRPEVRAAAARALETYGLGAAGSPHLSGLLAVHEELAEAIAAFKAVESVLLFPTGYSANVGTISALVGPGDVVITDILAHASILDGCAMSGATTRLFRHNDCESLEKKLAGTTGRVLVVVEGVYSMDGDVAPLDDIAALCRRYGARLMVDEAHSAFVFGEHGRGVVEHFGVEDQVDIHLGTLSKSLGGMGGYVGGTRQLIDYLRPYSRSQVFSCALAPAVVGGLVEAVRIARDEPQLRAKLWANVHTMREALVSRGVDVGDSASQVIPIMVRDDVGIFPITEELMAEGVFLNPVRYPAVKRNQSRFRVSVSAAHHPDELVRSAEIIATVLARHGVIA